MVEGYRITGLPVFARDGMCRIVIRAGGRRALEPAIRIEQRINNQEETE